MKLMVGIHNGTAGVFRLDPGGAVDLTRALPAVGTDLMALAASKTLLKQAETVTGPEINPAEITPKRPIERPGKTVCLGHNYAEHVKEGGYDIPEYPALFMRGPNSLVAAGEPMQRPHASPQFDFEAELMIIIGSGGRHIGEAEAEAAIFGYTLFNDGTIRDYQKRTHQWTPGKNFDATGAVGPIVVTPDELPQFADGLKIASRVNGEVMQDGTTTDMMWKIPAILGAISEYATLEPGDLIATGTPPGVGHARDPQVFLKPGDTVEVEIEGIGICANPVIAEG